MARDDSFEKFLATQDGSGSLKRLLLHRAALRRRARLPRSRQRQFDLGTLFWLIAIFCVCLVFFPAMLGKLGALVWPQCIVSYGEPEQVLQATATEDQP